MWEINQCLPDFFVVVVPLGLLLVSLPIPHASYISFFWPSFSFFLFSSCWESLAGVFFAGGWCWLVGCLVGIRGGAASSGLPPPAPRHLSSRSFAGASGPSAKCGSETCRSPVPTPDHSRAPVLVLNQCGYPSLFFLLLFDKMMWVVVLDVV